MNEFTKKQKQHLRTLNGIAYDREHDMELDKLFQEFKRWKSKELDGFELNDKIHEFHNNKSRELFKFYNNHKFLDFNIAVAVRDGFLTMDEIEDTCRSSIQKTLDGLPKR